MADTLNSAYDEADKAKSAAGSAATHAERSFHEATAAAKSTLSDTAKRFEKTVAEGLDTLRAQSRAYTDNAGQRIDEAQRYVTERVKERPLTATLAGVGVGLLLGLLLAGNRGGSRR